jgi:hypothetical protein
VVVTVTRAEDLRRPLETAVEVKDLLPKELVLVSAVAVLDVLLTVVLEAVDVAQDVDRVVAVLDVAGRDVGRVVVPLTNP